jgi:hypothetical protein
VYRVVAVSFWREQIACLVDEKLIAIAYLAYAKKRTASDESDAVQIQ